MRKFVSSSADIENEQFFPSEFKNNDRKKIRLIAHYSRTGVLESARNFQTNVVLSWNKNASMLSDILTLGVSKLPDSTKLGTGRVNIEMARDIGILEGGEGGSRFMLPPGYQNRTIFVFGD